MEKLISIADWGGFRKELAVELYKREKLGLYLTTNPKWLAVRQGIPANKVISQSHFRLLEYVLARSGILAKMQLLRSSISLLKDCSFVNFVARQTFVGHDFCFLSGCGAGLIRRECSLLKNGDRLFIAQRGSAHVRWLEDKLDDEYQRLGIPRKRLLDYFIAKEEFEYKHSDVIVVPSGLAARSFIDSGIDAQKIEVIPLGAPHVEPSLLHASRVPGQVVYVGQTSVRKGSHIFSSAVTTCDPVRKICMIGGTHDHKLSKELLKDSRVEWLGNLPRESVLEIIAKSQVLVLPSIEDGFGRVATEAMSVGTPVIVSDACGASEILTIHGGGLVVPAGSCDILREMLGEVLSSSSLWERLSNEAVAYSNSTKGWDAYAESFLRMIENRKLKTGTSVRRLR